MKELLEELIKKSLDDLYQNDKYLIKHRVAERDITSKFAHYFQNNMRETIIADYDVDCEYNRDGYGMKKIDGTLVYPDFILHKRGTNESNLLIIEFKTWWNSDNREDIEKLKAMMSEWYRYQYQYGYSIILNQERDSVTVTCVEH
jgi:hypothetical protein